ncbi:MAG: hypothetical protein ABSG31_18175 [Tepidisphaeraceae bacterium]|jgi:hypothetical protein
MSKRKIQIQFYLQIVALIRQVLDACGDAATARATPCSPAKIAARDRAMLLAVDELNVFLLGFIGRDGTLITHKIQSYGIAVLQRGQSKKALPN